MDRRSNIVRSYKIDELLDLPKDSLMEFIGGTEMSPSSAIFINNANDLKILKTWERHFRGIGTPYIIEQRGKTLFLWKERRVYPVTNTKEYYV